MLKKLAKNEFHLENVNFKVWWDIYGWIFKRAFKTFVLSPIEKSRCEIIAWGSLVCVWQRVLNERSKHIEDTGIMLKIKEQIKNKESVKELENKSSEK